MRLVPSAFFQRSVPVLAPVSVAEGQWATAGVAEPLGVGHNSCWSVLAAWQGDVDAKPERTGTEFSGIGEFCVAAVAANVVHAVGEQDGYGVLAGSQGEVVAAAASGG